MLRAHLTDTKRCYLHPHRVVQTACARCKTPYCDDCLETRDKGLFARIVQDDERQPLPLFCSRCIVEIEALTLIEAHRKRPFWQRLWPSRAGLHRAALYLAVATVILVPLAFAVRNISETTVTPEELNRIRVGLRGGFRTPDGVNVVSEVFGGSFIRATAPSQIDRGPSRLIDGWSTPEVPGWRSTDASLPQEMVFLLPQKTRINKATIRPHPSEPPATWVRDFEILISPESPDAGFVAVARGTLPTTGDMPAISVIFPEVIARYVTLRVLSNHGSSEYTSIAEFEVYWSPTGS